MNRSHRLSEELFVSTESYNVDRASLTVSGVSSGAIMASQLHVIYSSHVMGAGLVAGGQPKFINQNFLILVLI